MDLWDAYKRRPMGIFADSVFTLSTGERKRTSLSMVEGAASELGINKAVFQRYDDAHRYITATDVSYDLLLTVYEVNTRSALAARITREPRRQDWRRMLASLRALRMAGSPNFELRVMGLQNTFLEPLGGLDYFYRSLHGRLMEADLFGTEVRHIALDTKTGVPYDLLLLNRIYRPGELACTVSKDDFASKLGELAFV
jgi:hypothetical protein